MLLSCARLNLAGEHDIIKLDLSSDILPTMLSFQFISLLRTNPFLLFIINERRLVFMLLRDIINVRILCLNFGDIIEKAVLIFKKCKINAIPVVDKDKKLLSVFTKSNLYDALLKGASLKDCIDPYVNDSVISLTDDTPFDTVADIVKKIPVGAAPVIDKEGKVMGVLTKKNMVLTLLKKSEMLNMQLKAILDSMHNGVIVVNSEGEIRLVNSGAERIFKTTEASCKGLPFNSVIPDLNLTPALVVGEIKIGLKFSYGKITAIANITPLFDAGRNAGAIVIFQDLTDLEQVARELETVKALNKTLETVLNIIYDGIIVVDEKGYITIINRVFTDYLGIPPEALIGKHISKVLPETRLHIVAKNGIPEIGDIQNIQGKPIIVSRIPIVKEGKVVGVVGKATFPQLTEIKELAEKLFFLQNKVTYFQEELEKTKTAHAVLDSIVAESSSMKKIKMEIKQVAKSASTVLITGESGTGKERVAHAIHMCSERKGGPFVKVNCAAIPENLLEAEILGYAPGAFTGALKNGKPGRFEMADGGTIFLDEVGDMPISLQAKILRVIQEREFERLGDTRTRRVNVRILAATNKDLIKSIEEGMFREDLYYRLNVIGIHLPPLREHPEDIQPLSNSFIDKYNQILNVNNKGITADAMGVLLRHGWPGNIRELENVIERALNYSRSDFIQKVHLPAYLSNTVCVVNQLKKENNSYKSRLFEAEKEMILSAIKETGGNKTEAAKLLNISRSRLYVKMKQYGIT